MAHHIVALGVDDLGGSVIVVVHGVVAVLLGDGEHTSVSVAEVHVGGEVQLGLHGNGFAVEQIQLFYVDQHVFFGEQKLSEKKNNG